MRYAIRSHVATTRRREAFALAGLLLLILPIPGGYSQALPVRATTVIGFNGAYEIGKWLPIRVRVESDIDLRGEVTLLIREGSVFGDARSNLRYSAPVVLPRGSSGDYSFVVPSDTSAPITVSVTNRGQEVFSSPVDVRRFGVRDRLVVALSRHPSVDVLLDLPVADGESHFHVAYTLPEYLPEKWLGYDGVELLVIHDAPLRLDDRQLESIDRWVSAGGTLVVSGGAQFTARNAQLLSPLLPVRYLGLSSLTDLSSLERFGGAPFASPEPILISRTQALRGEVLLDAGGTPLIVREHRGKGSVYFFAFDVAQPPFDSWRGEYPLWEGITKSIPDRTGSYSDFTVPDLFKAGLIRDLLPLTEFSIPSATIAVVLLVLFACGAALLALVRLRILDRYRWAALVGYSLLFAALLWAVGYRDLRQSGSYLYSVARVETGDGRYGLVTEALLLASPRAESSSMTTAEPQSAVVQRAGDDLSVREDDAGVTVRDIPLGRWDYRNLTLQGMVPFPVESSVNLDNFRITATLHNGTEHDFLDGYLIYRGVPYHTGRLAADGTLRMGFGYNPAPVSESPETEWRGSVGDEVKLRTLDFILRDPAWNLTTNGDTVVYVGWLDRPVLDIAVSPAVSAATGVNVVMAIMRLEPA